jgi:DNA-binding NarL/FixJ family response regulator
MKRATVILVDDHPPLRAGVAAIIGKSGRYEVVAEAGSVDEACDELRRVAPDVLIIDVSLPDGTGLDVIRDARREQASIRILVLTMHARRSLADSAFDAGANGYLLKESTGDHLVDALDAIRGGRTFLDPRLESVVGHGRPHGCPDGSGSDAFVGLSGREFEVFGLLASGRTSKEIGSMLGISPKTVDNHRGSVMEKLGLGSIADLVRLAIRTGVVDP